MMGLALLRTGPASLPSRVRRFVTLILTRRLQLPVELGQLSGLHAPGGGVGVGGGGGSGPPDLPPHAGGGGGGGEGSWRSLIPKLD